MKPQSIRLFVKHHCPWCVKAMDWLDRRKVDYETIDVLDSDEAYEEMVRLSGQTLSPVIEVDGSVLADFGPEELAAFWERLETEREQAGS